MSFAPFAESFNSSIDFFASSDAEVNAIVSTTNVANNEAINTYGLAAPTALNVACAALAAFVAFVKCCIDATVALMTLPIPIATLNVPRATAPARITSLNWKPTDIACFIKATRFLSNTPKFCAHSSSVPSCSHSASWSLTSCNTDFTSPKAPSPILRINSDRLSSKVLSIPCIVCDCFSIIPANFPLPVVSPVIALFRSSMPTLPAETILENSSPVTPMLSASAV